MKKSIFALVGASLMLASGFVFTACSNDDDDDGSSPVAMTVTMTVNLTFDDFTAEKVIVKYGDENNADTKSTTVTATVASDKKSATFKVSDAYTNSYGYSQLISVSCYEHADDEEPLSIELSTADTGYWLFEEDGAKTIAYKLKAAATMTLSLTFDGFTATAVNVTYGCDDTETTEAATVADDGASATLALSNAYMNNSGWMCVKTVTASNGESSLSIECTSFDMWFAFTASGEKSFTYKLASSDAETLPYTADITADGNCNKFLNAATFADLTIASITVSVSNVDWSNATGWRWFDVYSSSSWANKTSIFNYDTGAEDQTSGSVTITDATVIAAIKENGLYLGGLTGMTGTVTVSYTAE